MMLMMMTIIMTKNLILHQLRFPTSSDGTSAEPVCVWESAAVLALVGQHQYYEDCEQ